MLFKLKDNKSLRGVFKIRGKTETFVKYFYKYLLFHSKLTLEVIFNNDHFEKNTKNFNIFEFVQL